MTDVIKLSRRRFLQLCGGAGAGLLFGELLLGCSKDEPGEADAFDPLLDDANAGVRDDDTGHSDAATGRTASDTAADAGPAEPPTWMKPSVFLAISSAGTVKVWVARTEMGQGIRTALAMVIAEELDADFTQVVAEGVTTGPAYGSMSTGGSMSVRYSWPILRKVGATARAMLVTAAANAWKVDASTCITEKGEVVHPPTGRRSAYGSVVKAAQVLPVPKNVSPRNVTDPKQYRVLGTSHKRVDAGPKVDGSAVFAGDVRLPGMLFAVVRRPDALGGSITSYDAKATLGFAGVKKVAKIPTGVAIIATNTWAAMRGRDLIYVVQDHGKNAGLDDKALKAILDAAAKKAPHKAKHVGNVNAALKAAKTTVNAVYEVPYAAHAPMEPFVSVAHIHDGNCDIWAPTQNPMAARSAVASALGMASSKVKIRTTLSGGRFGCGHRADWLVEAARIAKAAGAPVQVLWTREDDTIGGHHRPFSRHLMSGGVTDKKLTVLSHIVLSPSISGQATGKNSGLDWSAVKGVYDMPYGIPNRYAGYVRANTPVPITWWRSVHLSQNPFANECFFDELCHAAGRDPLDVRLELMNKGSRLRNVLQMAATKAGWGKKLPANEGLGLACCSAYGSHIGMVAHVAVDKSGNVAVKRVTAAVDCGIVINPDGVAAQVEGGVAYGLSAALHGNMTFKKGHAEERNFHTYPIVTMSDMPEVDTHLVASKPGGSIGGIGELAVPPIAPAVANAIFAATGKRVRKMPFGKVAV